jgi:hypothetical protein
MCGWTTLGNWDYYPGMSEQASTPSIFETVPGGPELLAWFGHEPSFHDAEIVSLHLNRTGQSTLSIRTREMTEGADSAGAYAHEKHGIVTFTLEDIQALNLEGFSHQNVIGRLELRRIDAPLPSFGMQWIEPPEPPPALYEIALEPCHGLAGTIQARHVSIALTPGEPASG